MSSVTSCLKYLSRFTSVYETTLGIDDNTDGIEPRTEATVGTVKRVTGILVVNVGNDCTADADTIV
jgi:hypothetical protein